MLGSVVMISAIGSGYGAQATICAGTPVGLSSASVARLVLDWVQVTLSTGVRRYAHFQYVHGVPPRC